MVEIGIEPGADIGQLQAVATCGSWEEMLPFLKLADIGGVPAHVVPTQTAETQQARDVRFDLDDIRDPESLAIFVTAFVALGDPIGSNGLIDRIRTDAQATRDRSLS